MSVRAKFRVDRIENFENGKRITARAVADTEGSNKQWSQATPSGTLDLFITNPAAYDQYIEGECIYLDMSPAPK